MMMGELIQHSRIKDDRELREMLEFQNNKILKKYQGDFNRFADYCNEQGRAIDFSAVQAYMKYSLTEAGIKRSTWDRRLAAIKKHLEIMYKLKPTNEELLNLRALRKFYDEEEFSRQRDMVGENAEDKDELIAAIQKLTVQKNGYDKPDTRMIAIAMVNLITANRPSEMTRLKVSDFNLKNRTVRVDVKKQSKSMYKMLTRDCIDAIERYVKEFGLTPDDYFVAKVNRYNTLIRNEDEGTEKMSEVGYNKLVKTKLKMNPYGFRKTQITAMHEAGADLSVIARQSGHESLETITKHYLSVRDKEVDKYI